MADFYVPYKIAADAPGSKPIHPRFGMRYVVPDLSQGYFRNELASNILRKIDEFALAKWNDGFRWHLGASLIGAECTRQTWYSFHWMTAPAHSGRMQRLFQRGHLEEFRYVEYLKGIGAQVWAHDTTQPQRQDGSYPQYRVNKLGGHFGGSLDGIVSLEHLGISGYLLGEFKTKGAGKEGDGKKFKELKEKGIMLTNPQHYDQMCTYGFNYNLPYALYMSTNKNDDDMHVEIVPLNFQRAQEVENKAAYIIAQLTPPPRISVNPTFWLCKNCDFRGVCHENKVPSKNCRSCQYSRPIDGGTWYCVGHGVNIPRDVVYTGCPQWSFIPSQPG